MTGYRVTRPLTATTVGELPWVMTTVRPRLPFCFGMREIWCIATTNHASITGITVILVRMMNIKERSRLSNRQAHDRQADSIR